MKAIISGIIWGARDLYQRHVDEIAAAMMDGAQPTDAELDAGIGDVVARRIAELNNQ